MSTAEQPIEKAKRRMKVDLEPRTCKNPTCHKGVNGRRRSFQPSWKWAEFCCVECRDDWHKPIHPDDVDAPARIKGMLSDLPLAHPMVRAVFQALQSKWAVLGNKSPKRKEKRDRH